jgi:hypothetical protein
MVEWKMVDLMVYRRMVMNGISADISGVYHNYTWVIPKLDIP